MGSTESQNREAALATIDTEVTAKILGSASAQNIIVPDDTPWITGYVPSGGSDGAATASGTFLARLFGNGIERQQELPLYGFGATLNTTHSTPLNADLIPTNIKVVPGNTLKGRFAPYGADTGTAEAAIELIFDREPRPGWQKMEYTALEVVATAVDTQIQLQGLGTAAADTFVVPKDVVNDGINGLQHILGVAASDAAGTGGGGIGINYSGGGIVVDQEHLLSGAGGTNATEANGHSRVQSRMAQIDVRPNRRITGNALMWGTDIGSVAVMVALGMAYSG